MMNSYNFDKHKTNLKKTSYDSANKEYMTQCEVEVIDFDESFVNRY